MKNTNLKRRLLRDGLYANGVLFCVFGLMGGSYWMRLSVLIVAWFAFAAWRKQRFLRAVLLTNTSGYPPGGVLHFALECYYAGLTVTETCERGFWI